MSELKASKHESYGVYTILAVIFPLIGLILGIVSLAKDDRLDKKLGEHTLAMSILFMILWSVLWVWVIAPALYEPVLIQSDVPVEYYGL